MRWTRESLLTIFKSVLLYCSERLLIVTRGDSKFCRYFYWIWRKDRCDESKRVWIGTNKNKLQKSSMICSDKMLLARGKNKKARNLPLQMQEHVRRLTSTQLLLLLLIFLDQLCKLRCCDPNLRSQAFKFMKLKQRSLPSKEVFQKFLQNKKKKAKRDKSHWRLRCLTFN